MAILRDADVLIVGGIEGKDLDGLGRELAKGIREQDKVNEGAYVLTVALTLLMDAALRGPLGDE